MIRASRAKPFDLPLTEEHLLAQMQRAGIDTHRLEVAAEARSLIETADKLRTALLNHSQIPLVHLIGQRHWKVTTRPHFEGMVRHGWDVTQHTSRGSLSIQVNQDDALRAMAAVVAFWLMGLAVLLAFLPTSGRSSGTPDGSRSSESPWIRLSFRLVAGLAGLAVVVTVIAFLPMVAKLVLHSSPIPQPGVKQSSVPHVTVETGTAAAHDDAATPTATLAPPQAVSAAEAEAKRLGLIRVVDELSEVYTFQQPIGLEGDAGVTLVDPYFSVLVRSPEGTSRIKYKFKQTADSWEWRDIDPAYRCNYIACDWTAGTDKPRIMGYLLPPGAYDFRADAETIKLLNEMDSTQRAKIAADTLTIIRAAALKSTATETDWQQATQAAHVRFKLVPKSISKLSVPGECLVVLTEKSRALFTREGGRFTKHEFVTADTIRTLRESINPTVEAIQPHTPADATAPENVPH